MDRVENTLDGELPLVEVKNTKTMEDCPTCKVQKKTSGIQLPERNKTSELYAKNYV